MFYENSCKNCKYWQYEEEEEPCCKCKLTAQPSSYEYFNRPLLFEEESGVSGDIPEFVPDTPANKVSQHLHICQSLNQIYERKNHDYGDSFGKGYAEYGMVMPVIRLEDKLNRLKFLINAEAKVNDESITDTLLDLANYAIMTVIERGDYQ